MVAYAASRLLRNSTKGPALLLLATSCGAYSTHKEVSIDCEVEEQYRLEVVNTFDDTGGDPPGWVSDDGSRGAVQTGAVEELPGEPRCGSDTALVVRAKSNNDWGSLFGLNGFAQDASEYEGLAFWARVGHNSNPAFTMLLNDPNTAAADTACIAPEQAPDLPEEGRNACVNYCVEVVGTGPVNQGTGMIIPGAVGNAPRPDQCGNGYTSVAVVSREWAFYTIPFSEFHQDGGPSRVPNSALKNVGSVPGTGLRTGELMNLVLRLPRAAPTELWIDNLGFYARK